MKTVILRTGDRNERRKFKWLGEECSHIFSNKIGRISIPKDEVENVLWGKGLKDIKHLMKYT